MTKNITQDFRNVLREVLPNAKDGVTINVIGEIHIGHDKEIQIGNRFQASIAAGSIISEKSLLSRHEELENISVIPIELLEEFKVWFAKLPYPRFDVLAIAAFQAAAQATSTLTDTSEYLGLTLNTTRKMNDRIRGQLQEG
uniref:Uncharacterized protein n=1 Tax=viral metagenome TaxID=1070528 RepID=A0A6M3LUA2_9ZZZZ